MDLLPNTTDSSLNSSSHGHAKTEASDEIKTALTELEQLQAIITRHSDLAYRTRGWLFALLTAIAIGKFSNTLKVESIHLLIISFLVISMFLIMELIHRVPQWRAVKRVGEVEQALQKKHAYEGPRITESLSPPITLQHMLDQAWNFYIAVPYAMMFCIMAAVAMLFPAITTEEKKPCDSAQKTEAKDLVTPSAHP